MSIRDRYIIDAVRTPIGKFGVSLSSIRTDDLAAHSIRSLMDRHDFDLRGIDDVIIGCANQAGEDNRNVARMALLLAGLPFSVPGETVNRLCASGMSAVIHAHQAVQSGNGELFIAGGVENMTRAPWVISKASAPFGRDSKMEDTSFGWRFINPQLQEIYGTDSMGQTAENVAERFGVSREDQDNLAVISHQRAGKAIRTGRFENQITEVTVPQRRGDPITVSVDEGPRPETTFESLQNLRPVFKKGGTVTAGNSSTINDGAASVVIMAEEKAAETRQWSYSNEGTVYDVNLFDDSGRAAFTLLLEVTAEINTLQKRVSILQASSLELNRVIGAQLTDDAILAQPEEAEVAKEA